MTDARPERPFEVVQLSKEDDLRSGLQRLRGSSTEAQELWLLGQTYELCIEIDLMCGQGPVPIPPTRDELREASGRTLIAELRGIRELESARLSLAEFDFEQPADEVAAGARTVIGRVSEAYLEGLSTVRSIRDHLDNVELIRDTSGLVLSFREQISMWMQQLRSIQQANRQLGLINHLTQRQTALTQSVQDAVEDAKKAGELIETKRGELAAVRAQEASRELSDHFKQLAKAERWKGVGLRVLSVVALVAALAVALSPESSWIPASSDDGSQSWSVLSRHLAITLLLAGAAAYAARLASTHYNFGQWAKSIQVQLDSFEGFVGVVEDAGARDRMREEFGRRVLGAPPQGSDEAATGLTTGELLQLMRSVRAPSGT